MLITPEDIQKVFKYEVFVFGSNESGFHGGGAAKLAYEKFGAKWGVGYGLCGNSFAIPTKDSNLNTLSLDAISIYIESFLAFAEKNQDLVFLVTKIGCGIAGYSSKDIAPLFKNAKNLENVALPSEFTEYL